MTLIIETEVIELITSTYNTIEKQTDSTIMHIQFQVFLINIKAGIVNLMLS